MLSKNRFDNQEIDLVGILYELLRNKYTILIITSVFAGFFMLYALVATPIYRGNMLLQVDDTMNQSVLTRMTDSLIGDSNHTSTEIGLLKSRSVLGRVSQELGLLVKVSPEGFFARFFKPAEPELVIDSMDVSPEYLNVPLSLRVIGPEEYELRLPDAKTLRGSVNRTLQSNGITLNVSHLNAAPGRTFNVTRLYDLDVVNSLLGRLNVADVGKESGLLSVQLTGNDKQLITVILNSIGRYYLEQGLIRKAEETTKQLEFIDELLPGIEKRLNDAIISLRSFQQENESVDMSLEAKAALDTATSLQTQLNEVMFRKAETSKLYTRDHPISRSLAEKETVLKKQLSKLNGSISNMPRKQQEILKLTRDVQSNQEIYTQMLTRRQELQIMKASTVNNARVVDPAVTETQAIAPKKAMLCIMGGLLGFILACSWVLFNKMMRSTIQSPSMIEDAGIELLAMIPVSKWLSRHNRKTADKESSPSTVLLATDKRDDISLEAIRNLRTSMTLMQTRKMDSIIAISSATAAVGKSFVVSNLAVLLAQAHKRVLVIDADMRCGTQHRLLSCEQAPGLSQVLKGKLSFGSALQKGPEEGLMLLSCGNYVDSSSELLMNDILATGLAKAAEHFDYIIIDTPPVLPVMDAAIIGRLVGGMILVAGYNKESMQEFTWAVNRFESNDIPLYGAVLNGIELQSLQGYSHGAFQYNSLKNEHVG